MICYKDQSFCASDCKNKHCWRFVSDEVKQSAEATGLPICYMDFSKECDAYVGSH